MLTRSPYSRRKSAPMIVVDVLAMTKIQQNMRQSPKSRVRDRVPKVAMGEPLTARRPEQSCLFFRSVEDGGMTLTSAPVSMKNWQPEVVSVRNSRRLVGRPQSLIAASNWPDRFPTSGRVADISWHHLQIFGDTSRGCHLRQVCDRHHGRGPGLHDRGWRNELTPFFICVERSSNCRLSFET